MAAAAAAAVTKLPVLRLVRHAYLGLAAGWRGYVQVGAPWLILPWVLHALGGVVPMLLGDIALTAGLAAVAVAWHRHVLLGEPLAGRWAPLRGEVARYLAYSVVIVALVALSSVLLAALTAAPAVLLGLGAAGGVGGASPAAGRVPALWLALGIAAGLASLLLAMRLQLSLPAAAVGERGGILAKSWRATRGNAWRLLAGFVLVTLPIGLAGVLLALLLLAVAEQTGSLVLGWLARLAPIAAAWVQAPLLAGFLSYCYAFADRPGAAAVTAAGPPGPARPPGTTQE